MEDKVEISPKISVETEVDKKTRKLDQSWSSNIKIVGLSKEKIGKPESRKLLK